MLSPYSLSILRKTVPASHTGLKEHPYFARIPAGDANRATVTQKAP
jgi:hypothetical protein